MVQDLSPYLFYTLKPRYDVLGPKLGNRTHNLEKELQKLSQEKVMAWLHTLNGNTLHLNDEFELSKDEVKVKIHTAENYSCMTEGNITVLLNTKVSKKLMDEGFVRDFVRYVQTARKDQELNFDSQIELRIHAPNGVWAVLNRYRGYVWKETQTNSWTNLNSTYFDLNDPEVKKVSYVNGEHRVEVLFSVKTVENLLEI
ncbi:MAG: Isoleucine--tRNA ligase [Candidatus Heimdallarchaeota archaeon LC_2]|nr:MAG: Isoleucine--tRNA ligase [Candidatus Heimdallarchaeota archaeon LC_2]